VSDEADLIRKFVAQWGARASGIGDDAAILDVPSGEKLVVSTDASVENVHFRRPDISAAEIGYRAAAAALSDLAAMAARPLGLLFALVLPVSWRDEATKIADGVGDAAAASSCPVIGGNISSGAELSITTTVLGSSVTPLSRSSARAGDSLYVTGVLGGAAAAVRAWSSGHAPDPEMRKRFVHPSPRIRESIWLASHGATSAIDISDGVAADAGHLAESSDATLTIDADLIPRFRGASLEDALGGGEDYELLLTGQSLDIGAFLKTFGLPLTRIGSVSEGPARVTFLEHGKPIATPGGFDHLGKK
jgi:thiamine-monophosphate kinase